MSFMLNLAKINSLFLLLALMLATTNAFAKIDVGPEDSEEDEQEETTEQQELQFEFSGYGALEFEKTRHFGFDGETEQENFNSFGPRAGQENFNFLSNLRLGARKNATSLAAVLEIGEIYFGHSASGGDLGAKSTNIFELRNFYLDHKFSSWAEGKAGIIPTITDPRAFIFNDHIASLHGHFTHEKLGSAHVWFGQAGRDRAGKVSESENYYATILSKPFFAGRLNTHLFGLYREKLDETLAIQYDPEEEAYITDVRTGKSVWIGTTVGYETELFNVEGTAINNWKSFTKNNATPIKDPKAYLVDALVSVQPLPWFSLSLEKLQTSGGHHVSDANSDYPIAGRRKNFSSLIGSSYLLTVATSDGIDDSPGSPKESTIASLSNDEGLKLSVLTASFILSEKFSTFARYGWLASTVDQLQTRSSDIGEEIDFGASYQLSPDLTLDADYGRFYPGSFFQKRARAELFTLRTKFVF